MPLYSLSGYQVLLWTHLFSTRVRVLYTCLNFAMMHLVVYAIVT
jgi:hypothetical protein